MASICNCKEGGSVVSNGFLLQLTRPYWPNIVLLNFPILVPFVYCPTTLSEGQLAGVLFYVPAKCFWCTKPEYLIAVVNTEYNFTKYVYFRCSSEKNALVSNFMLCIFCELNTRENIIYNKPTRYNSGSIVFINNYMYALHVSDALCVHHQEHYKL